jgi:hypothetical protein
MNKKMARARHNSQAAADTLSDLANPTAHEGKPGLPAEAGKPGLPEPDPEPEYPDYSEEDSDEEDQKPSISFTEQDRRDLALLEKKAEGRLREAAQALREIRQRQLWRLAEDEDGKPLNYPNFETYCQDHLGHSRQWVTHLTNWLRIKEEADALGLPVPHLTVKAAQGLLNGRLQDAGGLRAVLEEAKEEGVAFDRDHLREIVLRRADYNRSSAEGTEGVTKPAARSYAEYKKDLATVKELGNGQTSWDVVQRAKALGGDLGDNLVALCRQERVLPRADNLLAVLTGEALEGVVSRLKEVGKERAEIEEKKKLLKARKLQLKEMLQEEGLKKIREEAKALEEELKAKGVLKAKRRDSSQAQAPQGESTPARNPDGEAEEGEVKAEGGEAGAGAVRENLATALEYLEEALSESQWPAAADDAELNAIFRAAHECEQKLAEISAKAKELLADAGQPVAGGA